MKTKRRRRSAAPAPATNGKPVSGTADNGHLEAATPILVYEAGDCSCRIVKGDARAIPLPGETVDLVVTSPPYWRKRDYGVAGQIGQEETPEQYVEAIMAAMTEWGRLLRPTGSVFLNIGDTYHNRSLVGIPGRIAATATAAGWLLRNQIVWAKDRGMPGAVQDRLVNRHEYVLHFTKDRDYYYDLFGYAQRVGRGANPGDVWHIRPTRDMGEHLAPFPREIVERAILLACPEKVCLTCGQPSRRIVERTTQLDPNRPQARRAMELAKEYGLTDAHIAAVQAVGVSDAGKALQIQNGTGRNSEAVKKLAAEAKKVLGGYFREFTFAQRKSVGWTDCGCRGRRVPGVVLDPFCGTATTLRTALSMGRSAIGVDLAPPTAALVMKEVVVAPDRGADRKRGRGGEKKLRDRSDSGGGGEGLFE